MGILTVFEGLEKALEIKIHEIFVFESIKNNKDKFRPGLGPKRTLNGHFDQQYHAIYQNSRNIISIVLEIGYLSLKTCHFNLIYELLKALQLK